MIVEEALVQELLVTTSSTCFSKTVFYDIVTDLLNKVELTEEYSSKVFITVLRSCRIIKKRYYQLSSLGHFFMAYPLVVSSYLKSFDSLDLPSEKEKPLAYMIMVYTAVSSWFYHATIATFFTSAHLLSFQAAVKAAFGWTEVPEYIEQNVRDKLSDLAPTSEVVELHPETRKVSVPSQFPDFTVPPPRKTAKGYVLRKVIEDVYLWMVLMDQERSEEPYFDVNLYAATHTAINPSAYRRTLRWLFRSFFSTRQENFLNSLEPISTVNQPLAIAVVRIRETLTPQLLYIEPNSQRLVLLHPTSPSYLSSSCEDCHFLETSLERNCKLFHMLSYLEEFGEIEIPQDLRSSYKERFTYVFPDKVACPFINDHTVLPSEHLSDKITQLLTTKRIEFSLTIEDPKIIKKLPSNPQVIRITDTDRLYFNPSSSTLRVNSRYYTITNKTIIDTKQWEVNLKTLHDSFPQLPINLRFIDFMVRREDKARIIYQNSLPVLSVKRKHKKKPFIFPLHHLKSLLLIGKPRLSSICKKWNINVINMSIKGVHEYPLPFIVEAINLPGVRDTLRSRFMQALSESIVNATKMLLNLAISYNYLSLAENIQQRLDFLVSQDIPTVYQKFLANPNHSPNKNLSLFEAWLSRPFAEGLREILITHQSPSFQFINPHYGRLASRKIRKSSREVSDSLAAYSPFDCALNTLNRYLRNYLRIINAKLGLGYKTVPLFSHVTPESKGKSGHLDLEEVGRLLSRLVLTESILKGELKSHYFLKRYDDNFIPYYIPSSTLKKILYNQLFRSRLLNQIIANYGKCMSYQSSHIQQVKSLFLTLKNSFKLTDHSQEMQLASFQPTILAINL